MVKLTHRRDKPILVYVVIAVITFGYAATNDRSIVNGRDVPLAALVSAGLWPLYWSWEAFALGRAALADGGRDAG